MWLSSCVGVAAVYSSVLHLHFDQVLIGVIYSTSNYLNNCKVNFDWCGLRSTGSRALAAAPQEAGALHLQQRKARWDRRHDGDACVHGWFVRPPWLQPLYASLRPRAHGPWYLVYVHARVVLRLRHFTHAQFPRFLLLRGLHLKRERERVDVITFKFCLKILDLLVLIHISLLLTYFSSSSLGTSLISLYNSFYFSSYQDFFLSTALIAVHGGICSTGSRISYSFFF